MTRPTEYHWTLGHFDHIEFPGGGDPVPAAPTQMSAQEGHSCISDDAGNLLMYTNGVGLWDGSLGSSSQIVTSGMGGHQSSTTSAIIVPPAGPGGTDYHVFAVGSDDDVIFANSNDPVVHSTYRVVSGTVTQILPPTALTIPGMANFDKTERMAAISHVDCDKFWVIVQDGISNNLSAILVASDARPTAAVTSSSALQSTDFWEGGYMKISPDGTVLAFADMASKHVALLRFDRATGMLSDMHPIKEVTCYGLEFSADSKTLYLGTLDPFNGQATPSVRAHTIANGAQAGAALPIIYNDLPVLAMQLAPNGKIYGRIAGGATLFEIGQPNTPLSPAATTSATYADGTVIQLSAQNQQGGAGLPNFTRIADACLITKDSCADIAAGVDAALTEQAAQMENRLKPCEESAAGPEGETCTALDLPHLTPRISITWGNSPCDGMESDDTEVMSVTICNPYSNVTFTALTAAHMHLVTEDGSPVPSAPDGTPSVTLVPRGPQCFGDIAPCSCVTREFAVRTRGAKPGAYHLHVDGICFDVCMHQDTSACFILPVCKD